MIFSQSMCRSKLLLLNFCSIGKIDLWIQRYEIFLRLSLQRYFFHTLYEMNMDNRAIRCIMGITQEAIRSTRYRILQNGRK